MVSFGSWQEAPDQVQSHTLFGDSDAVDPYSGALVFDYRAGYTWYESPYSDPPPAITVSELMGMVEGAYEVEGEPGPFGVQTTWGTAYAWAYNLVVPDGWSANRSASVVKRQFRITSQPYSFSPVSEGYWVEGAIGIDYEGQPYDPANPWAFGPSTIIGRSVSNEAPTVLRGHWREEYVDAPPSVPMAATEVWFHPDAPSGSGAVPTVMATVSLPPAPSDGVNPLSTTLPAPIDLTSKMHPDYWGGVLWTRTGFVPPDRDPGPYDSGSLQYGWGFDDVRIDTVVRPPRWRWVFAAEPPASYRRIFPRDDGLGGGAPRIYPPSKGAQSSNRTSGGYF
jgi:hypothetical protein